MIGNFERFNAPTNTVPFKKKASTAFGLGDAVYVDANGFLDRATSTTNATDIVGVINQTIASTDSDYAANTDVAVEVARKGNNADWFLAKVSTGTPAQTHVGESHELDASGKVDLNAASSKNAVKIERIIDATTVAVTFN